MSDEDEFQFYDEQNVRSKKARARNRANAASVYVAAAELAKTRGMELINHDSVHYKLWGPERKWRKELYPGNGRIYAPDREGPFLSLPERWTLLDVVKAAIEAIDKVNKQKGLK